MKPAPPLTRIFTPGSSPRGAAPRYLPEAVQRARGRLGLLEGERAAEPLDLPQHLAGRQLAQRIARSGKALAPGRLHQAQQLPLRAEGGGEHLGPAANRAGAPTSVITAGGVLHGLATAHGDPRVQVPPGMPPRAALPYLFLPMVSALRRLTHMGELSGEWAEAGGTLRAMVAELGPQSPRERNPAKQLAERLFGHMPAVYASSPDLAAAAYRWKSQLNENGKVLALWHAFPELNHNEAVGWEDGTTAARLAVVLLGEPAEDAAVARRIAATRQAAFRSASSVSDVTRGGSARLGA